MSKKAKLFPKNADISYKGIYMRIDEIMRIQESFKQKSQGKSIGKEITEKIEFNVIEALMGKNKAEMPPITQTNPAYNLSLSKPPPPDWTYVPSKSEPAMSEAEFEEAIKSLALEYAERATEIGNSGKSNSIINKEIYNLNREFEWKEGKLQALYLSVVSPDRKTAYNKSDGNVVNGSEPNYWGENRLMDRGPSGWAWYPTSAEIERMSKLGQIRKETLDTYEAEHGQIPYTTISKTWVQ